MCESYEQNEELFDRKLCQLREKQSKCIHPSVKCSLCGLYDDRIKTAEKKKIRELKKIIILYEKTTGITVEEIMM